VQNVLEKDVEWLCDHLFTQNGVIFICGGTEMSKDVGNVIFKSLVLHTKVPYKAFSLSSQLKQQRVIVEEIFG
jgi:sulfite reductase alpha subunit-like flavoprotein